MAVTGTYFEPYNDWPGQGPRPLIVYGPGTQGQGDQCAPSRQFNQGIHWSPWLDIAFNYEELFVATMVARGFAIVMTDYQGLGTPGLHTYVNRVAEGNAMLDAGRAAMRLPDTSLDPAWAGGVLGLLAGRRRRGVGGRTGAVLRSRTRRRRHLRGRAARRPQGALPLRRRQRAGGRRRLRAQLRDHHLSGVRGRDPRQADAARRGSAVQGPGPVHRRDHHQVHVPAPAALLQRGHLPAGQRGTVQARSSTCSASAAASRTRRC